MKTFLNFLNILGCLSLFLIIPVLVVWFFKFYIFLKIISIIILANTIYIIIKKLKLKHIGIKILAIMIITITFSHIIYLLFGFIMQSQTSKLVNEISSIQTYMMYPDDKYSHTINKSSYEKSIKFVNVKEIFSKGSYNAKVTFKDGKSIITNIKYSNPNHPIIRIYNYNYMLY